MTRLAHAKVHRRWKYRVPPAYFGSLEHPSGPSSLPHAPSASFKPLQHTSPYDSLQPHSGPYSPVQIPSPTLRRLRPLRRPVSGSFGAPRTTRPKSYRRIDPRDTEHNKRAQVHIAHPSRASRAPSRTSRGLPKTDFFPGGFSDTFENISGPFKCTLRVPSRSSGVPASSCVRTARSVVVIIIVFSNEACVGRRIARQSEQAQHKGGQGQGSSHVYRSQRFSSYKLVKSQKL